MAKRTTDRTPIPERRHTLDTLLPSGQTQRLESFPTRQVHLDFHTSELIKGVGRRFNTRQFQKALKLARVNSVTVFAKCHHGWSYYPTRVKNAFVHPHLHRDLLGEQIRAAHAIGVRAPIYMTVGWSANDARLHPEWVVRKLDGSIEASNVDAAAKPSDPRPAVSWQFLDPTGDCKRLIIEQTAELCSRYPVDGFFYDICAGPVTLIGNTLKSMGFDAANPKDVVEYRTRVWQQFMSEITNTIRRHHPTASIFFNGNAGFETDERLLQFQTHYELEDLPTTWGGYDKFPLRAKLFLETQPRKVLVAMSGKFHANWGEFGGFKHPDAMRFEAAGMMAWGARCSFGDQLHPSGEMDLETYNLIGKAYADVSMIEDFCVDSEPAANLAIFVPPASATVDHSTEHAQGVANMLLETHCDFRVIRDLDDDLSSFDTIILPGDRFLKPPTARRLNQFARDRGSLLVIGESALHRTSEKVLLNVGARYAGRARFDCDYTAAAAKLAAGSVRSPFLNYEPAGLYVPTSGKALAKIYEPYFSRTYDTYCSHQNTPYQLAPARHAAAIRCSRTVLLPHPLGRLYLRHGAFVHRQLLHNALRLLHKRPMIDVQMPSAGRVNLMHQPHHGRYVIHLLYASPMQRGRCLIVEDLPILRDIPLTLRLPKTPQRISLPQQRRTLQFQHQDDGSVCLRVPEMRGHQMIIAQYR